MPNAPPAKPTIRIKRIYDAPTRGDGIRILVDRIWPRGIAKDAARLDGWFKDLAPSTKLRQWFGHDPERWEEFQRRYVGELDEHPETWRPLLDALSADDITLLYSSHDTEHNNAVALRRYLLAHRPAGATPDQVGGD